MEKTNLELKHRCDDFVGIRNALRELGARKEHIVKQKDYFFNLPAKNHRPPPRLKLRFEGSRRTLIYYERPNFTKTTGAVADIKLYAVRDSKLLPFLQTALGVQTIVEKTRELWRKDATVFHLDTVKGVGGIFEIELQKRGSLTKKDRSVFASYQEALLPYLGTVVKGSNSDLVTNNTK